jgi:cytochrome c oxidase subunit II
MRVPRPISIAVAALFAAMLARAQEPTPAPVGEPRRITITAKKYEFNPSKVELVAGEPVEIVFHAEDATHGFTCKELGVEKVVVEKGKTETFKLTAEKPGTYEFKCAKWCGFGHGKMKGEIVVTAPQPPGN